MRKQLSQWFTLMKSHIEVLIAAKNSMLPGLVIVNLEKAFHVGLQDVVWKNINVKGCYFHLAQSIRRQIQDENLVDLHVENEAPQLKMKMLAALVFATPNLLIHYFEILQKDNPSKLEPLFDYFKDNYQGCSLRQQ